MSASFVTGFVSRLGLFLGSGGLCGGVLAADVSNSIDEQTGLQSWKWQQQGISIQLVQRLPDQTRAFFQARSFSSGTADDIAQTCVFQTIFRNDGKQSIDYDLKDWVTTSGQRMSALSTRDHWESRWKLGEVTNAARIALRWSLLPTRQQFMPGDYNWGMISFGLAPATAFDLALVLNVNGAVVHGQIPGMVCAADLPEGVE